MQIELTLRDVSPSVISDLEVDPEYDDVRTLLSDVCEQIDDSGRGVFTVSGFGDDSWPVQLSTDLPVLLEQLPSAIEAASNGLSTFTIDFYEQGIERTLHFKQQGTGYVVECTCYLDWNPVNSPEPIEKQKLIDMLLQVQTEFMNFMSRTTIDDSIRKYFFDWAFVSVAS